MAPTRATRTRRAKPVHTPIYFNPRQVPNSPFISFQKLPAFIEGSRRATIEVPPFGPREFRLAHFPDYVRGILNLTLTNGFGTVSRAINDAMGYSAASLWAACDHVLQQGGIACAAAQGFHHAGYNFNGGFCTINGLVIAARKALAVVPRVLIIDGDAHYGDGTADCITALNLADRVIHITREDGIGDAQAGYTQADWQRYTADLLETHRPGLVIYQAGADAWIDDPFDFGYLTFEAMAWRDSGIFDACLKANVPVAWDLAGGYSEPMDMTVSLHLQTLRCSDLALRRHVQRQRRAERRRAERRLADRRRAERRHAAGAR